MSEKSNCRFDFKIETSAAGAFSKLFANHLMQIANCQFLSVEF
jgi:hypothetical protein